MRGSYPKEHLSQSSIPCPVLTNSKGKPIAKHPLFAYRTTMATNTPKAAYANPSSRENRPASDLLVAADAAPVVEVESLVVVFASRPADSQSCTTAPAASV